MLTHELGLFDFSLKRKDTRNLWNSVFNILAIATPVRAHYCLCLLSCKLNCPRAVTLTRLGLYSAKERADIYDEAR